MTDEGTQAVTEGALLWKPSEERKNRANLTAYLHWLRDHRGLAFPSYDELWSWSVTDLEAFWASMWEFFDVRAHRPYERVLGERSMPGARWFPEAELNFAEHALRRRDDHLAVLFKAEDRPLATLTYAELANQVAAT